MYHSKIEAALPADVIRIEPQPEEPCAGDIVFGMVLLFIGLPVLLVRLLIGAAWRDLRRVGRLAGMIGASAIEARRTR